MSMLNWDKSPIDPRFKELWDRVEALESKGQPRQAMVIIDDIITLAGEEKEQVQWLKGLQYKANFMAQLEESGAIKAIDMLESHVPTADNEIKPLLQATIAKKLQQYLASNAYRMANRTTANDELPKDKERWSPTDFVRAVMTYYTAALDGARKMSDDELANYEEVLSLGKHTAHLMPTVYDFIAHQALSYLRFEAGQHAFKGITEPVNWTSYMIPAKEFIALTIDDQNPSDFDRKALKLYQQLLTRQINQKDKDPFLHTELARLEYISGKAGDADRTKYKDALTALSEGYSDATEWPLVQYHLATYYQAQASQSKDKLERARDMKRAHTILKNAIDKSEKSYGREQCQQMLEGLEMPSLSMQFEYVWIPNQPTIVLLDYKNIDQVEWKIGKMSHANYFRYFQDYKYRNNKQNILRDADIIQSEKLSLEDKADFTNYSKEVVMDGLQPGAYCLFIENKEHKVQSLIVFQVSQLSFMHQQGLSGENKIVVVDRKTGDPVAGATVELYPRAGYGRKEGAKTPTITGVTDANGFYYLENLTERSYRVAIRYGEDTYQPQEYVHANRRSDTRTSSHVSIFTDRGIYRPGQNVMYKIIAYQKDGNGLPSLLTNKIIKVEFLDANYQVVATQEKTTNEFGSVHGEFKAPTTGLKGMHRIRVQGYGEQGVRVEEYKRPKFNVELTTPEAALVMGEEITVPGFAKLFAGPAVENANVSYQVTQGVSYHYGWFWRGYGGDSRKLIATGNTKTNADGEFTIAFDALNDASVNRRWAPIYTYTITADVTDANGETRTGELTLRVGAEPYYISSNIAGAINADVLQAFTLSSKNAMQKPSPASVKVEITELIAPAQYQLGPRWSKPDYPLSVDEKARFPWLDFDEQWKYENWKKGNTVYQESLEINGDLEVVLENKLSPAVYELVVKDAEGEVKHKQYFTAYSIDEKSFVTNELLVAQQDKDTYAPGDEVRLLLASPIAQARVLLEVEKNKQIIRKDWLTINGTQELTIPVQEADRGGFVVRATLIYENRAVAHVVPVNVPWSNKNLKITWETFRDKLLPGQQETWRLKIQGADKEAVAAELLANMYDASLDEFVPHNYFFSVYPTYSVSHWSRMPDFGLNNAYAEVKDYERGNYEIYRQFPDWLYLNQYGMYSGGRMMRGMTEESAPMMARAKSAAPMAANDAMMMDEQEDGSGIQPPSPTESSADGNKSFAPRTNLNETVFFLPQLRTDAAGNVVLEFTMNEALTAWKLQLLAHTKDLAIGMKTEEVVTQKDIMVFPQLPRFIREGDRVLISTKINKLTDKDVSGHAWIDILDAENGKSYTKEFVSNPKQRFSIASANATAVDFNVSIPAGFVRPLEIIVRAEAGKHTDGESNIVPVLTNSMLITETIPMAVRAGQTKTFDFKALRDMGQKGSRPFQLTLEYMENPVWFAVQSLPYLTDYPHKCTEQIAHKVYANAIASHIIKQYPKIQAIFKEWESKDQLISNLNKNQELKYALIEETPWLRDVQSEEEQMKNIGLLFDFDRMAKELDENINILIRRQRSHGAFPWFADGRDNAYITQLVVEIMGHLSFLGIDLPRQNEINTMVDRAISFSFDEMKERYDRLPKKDRKKLQIIDGLSLHAIYSASFYPSLGGTRDFDAYTYYYTNAKEKWVDFSLYQQALLASATYRKEDVAITEAIVASFKDRALRSEELGMYYKYNRGYYWYNQPIETQAHIMEAISLVDKSSADLNEMRVWLLKNKQTNRWSSTISTAKAIYALLLRGDDWLGTTVSPTITLGDEVILSPTNPIEGKMAGTGYVKKKYTADEITKSMHTIKVENPNQVVSWGAGYYQYFQSIDKVEKYNDNPLSVRRSVFRKIRTDQGERLEPITADNVKVGDKVTVRLEITVDRMMEFIHLKDLRAAGFEPVDVLSGYQWDGGLGYYQSTTDLGTHFFIDYIQQGTYVLEYDAFAANAGDFSGGLATLQCMYAPEFTSHSEGSRFAISR